MAKIHDEVREQRIIYDVIVDCYDEDEQLMGWYYYMAEGLNFPIQAVANLALRGGKTEQKEVQIVSVDPKSEQGNAIRLGITEGDSERVQYISPERFVSIQTSEANLDIINDWLYWHDFDLL